MTITKTSEDVDEYSEISGEQMRNATLKLAGKVVRRGRPEGRTKEPVTLRLDKDVLERWKATGPGWQTRINNALRKAPPA